MTVQQMMQALPVLQKLLELPLPVRKAHKIFSLAKTFNEQRTFFLKEEYKLIEKYHAEVIDNGGIQFQSLEDKTGFAQEHQELMGYELAECEKIELSFDELQNIELTPKDIMLLEGVIDIIE